MTARAIIITAFAALFVAGVIYTAQHTKPVAVPQSEAEEKPLGWDDPDGFPWVLKGQRKPTDMHYSKVIGF